jgi:hypothetical protein
MTPPDRLPGSEAPARVGFGMSQPGRHSAGSGPPEEAASEAETLSPGARVNLVKEREVTGIDEVFESLDADLVGLTQVKTKSARSPRSCWSTEPAASSACRPPGPTCT